MKLKQRALTSAAAVALACGLAVCNTGCSQQAAEETTTTTDTTDTATEQETTLDLSGQRLTADDISTTETYESSADGEHAIEVSGEQTAYSNAAVNKTGEADGDEADFYGSNAAVFATESATLNLSDMVVTTNGTHANGVFSYGEGTTLNISHSVINTTGNCSGGLMTTGGGTTNATDVTAETTGNSSAAIRSDRGGGTVNVQGGYYTTAGTGSPVIYSTADVNVDTAYLESTSSQGVVIEGKNSATLTNCQLIANNTSKNSDNSDTYQAVMIYQSMSGDASVGESAFEMDGGTLTNANGDIFFVNNTTCTITLNNAKITNNDASGLFLRAEAAGWGSEGSNGGKVNLNATAQDITGNMVVDDVSVLNLNLAEGSQFVGAINTDGQAGDVYVELDGTSTWVLTADSYISSLTCVDGSIDLNGHTLYVDGVAYTSGASTGTAFDTTTTSTGNGGGEMGGGDGGSAPNMPSGEGGEGGAGGDKPDAAPTKPE